MIGEIELTGSSLLHENRQLQPVRMILGRCSLIVGQNCYQNVFIGMFMNGVMYTSQGQSQRQRSQSPEQDRDNFLPRLSAPQERGSQQTLF